MIGGSIDPSVTGYASAYAANANCGTPIISHSDQVVNNAGCNNGIVILRTWTAQDPNDASLVSSCVQIVVYN